MRRVPLPGALPLELRRGRGQFGHGHSAQARDFARLSPFKTQFIRRFLVMTIITIPFTRGSSGEE